MLDAGICAVSLEPKIGMMGEERERAAGSSDPGQHMKWKKFTLETTTDAVDYLGSMFDDIGIEGMEIEDNVPLTESETKGMFIDILPELPPDDGTARVSFYLDEDEDAAEKLKAVREGPRQTIRTGSTTGNSTSNRLRLTIS